MKIKESDKPESNFTELESCLIMLNHVAICIKNAVEFQEDGFEKLLKITSDYEKGIKEKYNNQPITEEEFEQEFLKTMQANPEVTEVKKLSPILMDYLIINLSRLLEIHPILAKNLREIGEEMLEKSLQDFWQPIQKQAERIMTWRNKIVAHADERAKKILTYPEVDENYEFFPREVFLMSVCALLYTAGISRNIPESVASIESHKRYTRYPKNAFKIVEWQETHKELGQLIENAKKTLEKNGYYNGIDEISGRKYPRKFFESKTM